MSIEAEDVLIAFDAFGDSHGDFPLRSYYEFNNRLAGTYTWQDNNCFYNGELIPLEAVEQYEDLLGQIENQRQANLRDNVAYLEVIWVNNLILGQQGTKLLKITGINASVYTVLQENQEGLIFTERYFLNPGLRNLEVSYMTERITGSRTFQSSNYTFTTTTGTGILHFSFEAGKSYALIEAVNGIAIQYSLREIPYKQHGNLKERFFDGEVYERLVKTMPERYRWQ